MPVFRGSRYIGDVRVGNTLINRIYKGSQLVYDRYSFPTQEPFPSAYTTEQVATVSGANYLIYDVLVSGYYSVVLSGSPGGNGYGHRNGGVGGGTSQVVYLYAGQKCLLWGSSAAGSKRNIGYTGYPGTKDNSFGGFGASGHTYGSEGGGGGGGSAENGRTGNTDHFTGAGGAGSGFIAGFTNITVTSQSKTAGSLTRNINYSLNANVISFTAISSYILAGGGGGGRGDEGEHRSSGGGGGAFGRGGNTKYTGSSAQTGPAGEWGAGGYGSQPSGLGAWCIFDFSRNQLNWGNGGGVGLGNAGYCTLYYMRPTTSAFVTLTINPDPLDSVVRLISGGYPQIGNSISVPVGSTVTYVVSKEGYEYIEGGVSYPEATGSVVVSTNTSLNVTLTEVWYTLTVNSNPSGASVVLTATGYTQSGNSIRVRSGVTVQYYVYYNNNYNTVTDVVEVESDITLTIPLQFYNKTFTAVGEYTMDLLAGDYQAITRGGGGAGGESGHGGQYVSYPGGAGGCGASSTLQTANFTLSTNTTIKLGVGEGGKTKSNGGNGGDGGSGNGYGGSGGGGGRASWVVIPYVRAISISQGGAGGGGGGGGRSNGRYHVGSGGGGGGGAYTYSYYYSTDSINVIDHAGRAGGRSNGFPSGGSAGGDGWTQIGNLKGGKGSSGSDWSQVGGNGGSGCGAGGGGGGPGNNHSSAWGGAGGGGAGGDWNAGGGFGGEPNANSGSSYASQHATNPTTTPFDTTSENATYGVSGDYGSGGTTDTNGVGGFVRIIKV